METWTSPNGVDHLVPDNGPCATCGRSHKDDLIVAAIADDILALAGGDARKAQVLAAAYLSNDDDLPLSMRPGFDPELPGKEAEERSIPRFGATDYAEDWS